MGNRCFKDKSSGPAHDDLDMESPASHRKEGTMTSAPNGTRAANWSTLPSLEDAFQQRKGIAPPKHGPDLEESKGSAPPDDEVAKLNRVKRYQDARKELVEVEKVLAFDYACSQNASRDEQLANKVLQKLREKDKALFATKAEIRGYHNRKHKRHPGDHHLTNLDLVQETELFKVARKMPKGAHLHIHFNACLDAAFLLDLAKDRDSMYIGSNRPVLEPRDLHECAIQFTTWSPPTQAQVDEPEKAKDDKEKNAQDSKPWEDLSPQARELADLFSKTEFDDGESQENGAGMTRWMKYKDFRAQFKDKFPTEDLDGLLRSKLVWSADEAHGVHQTADSAWAKFDGQTRMMKGLFNYETAYKEYTKQCLQDFIDDNIQYAEIRPTFMETNKVLSDNGKKKASNREMVRMIQEQCSTFIKARKDGESFFQGIKVIYCTPRSFEPVQVEAALNECLSLKLDKEVGNMIAGFDLVGKENGNGDKATPLVDHAENLLRFQAKCAYRGVEIPFLLHCGETLEMGTKTDGNVVDALLLGSKRIGHGFALARHPYIMERMKKQNVCLEACPISNEILGLTPRISGHSMYNLLANNVHCTVNSDNGTMFRSSLSHDFYQVFVGKHDFTLHGWRQLIEWSLEHACLSEDEYANLYKEWRKLWDKFVGWILTTYDAVRREVEAGEAKNIMNFYGRKNGSPGKRRDLELFFPMIERSF